MDIYIQVHIIHFVFITVKKAILHVKPKEAYGQLSAQLTTEPERLSAEK